MSEVLVEFDTVLHGDGGSRWVPRACARVADDGLWEGWIEFIPTGSSGEPMRTGRETEQADRNGVLYWAEGLTQVYLEGALQRALQTPPAPRAPEIPAEPVYDGPQPSRARVVVGTGPHPVLNPFEVYQQGEDVLVSELSALDATRLRDIVVAYGFSSPAEAADANAGQLTTMILARVRRPATARDEQQPRDRRPG